MYLIEWSDTQLKFKITETESWATTNVDLTQYEKVLITIKYSNWIVEKEWTVDDTDHSLVVFDILSEETKWRRWKVSLDIWWVYGEQKNRFNEDTIVWKVLPSIKVPEWVVSD